MHTLMYSPFSMPVCLSPSHLLLSLSIPPFLCLYPLSLSVSVSLSFLSHHNGVTCSAKTEIGCQHISQCKDNLSNSLKVTASSSPSYATIVAIVGKPHCTYVAPDHALIRLKPLTYWSQKFPMINPKSYTIINLFADIFPPTGAILLKRYLSTYH